VVPLSGFFFFQSLLKPRLTWLENEGSSNINVSAVARRLNPLICAYERANDESCRLAYFVERAKFYTHFEEGSRETSCFLDSDMRNFKADQRRHWLPELVNWWSDLDDRRLGSSQSVCKAKGFQVRQDAVLCSPPTNQSFSDAVVAVDDAADVE
jgi:hypothetical protein